MSKHIVSVRLSEVNANTTDKITHVRFSNGSMESVPSVVQAAILFGTGYYYTTADGRKADVEAINPANGAPYIRTKANITVRDNLLNLPRF